MGNYICATHLTNNIVFKYISSTCNT